MGVGAVAAPAEATVARAAAAAPAAAAPATAVVVAAAVLQAALAVLGELPVRAARLVLAPVVPAVGRPELVASGKAPRRVAGRARAATPVARRGSHRPRGTAPARAVLAGAARVLQRPPLRPEPPVAASREAVDRPGTGWFPHHPPAWPRAPVLVPLPDQAMPRAGSRLRPPVGRRWEEAQARGPALDPVVAEPRVPAGIHLLARRAAEMLRDTDRGAKGRRIHPAPQDPPARPRESSRLRLLAVGRRHPLGTRRAVHQARQAAELERPAPIACPCRRHRARQGQAANLRPWRPLRRRRARRA